MKKIMIYALLLFCIEGCKKASTSDTNTIPPDPAGTLTINLPAPGSNLICNVNKDILVSGGVPVGVVSTGLFLGLDNSLNLYYNIYANFNANVSASIVNLGAVSGLGSITSYPTSGFTASTAAALGNGYVIKIKDYDPTSYRPDRIRYYRFYLVSYQLSTTGGILGINIKYEGPY